MPRTPIVSRNLDVTITRVEMLDKLTGELITKTIPISRHWEGKQLEKKVKDLIPIRYKFYAITEYRHTSERYTMTEQQFIFAAHRIGGDDLEV